MEVRIQDNYKTGLRQFEGELKVTSPTNDESAMQIFGNNGDGATTLMIRSFSRNGGTLRGGGKDLVSNIYGKWVRVNVTHDATANKYSVYINGDLKVTANGPKGTHYFKYGVYGTLGTASAQHQWRNVHFYRKLAGGRLAAPMDRDVGPPGCRKCDRNGLRAKPRSVRWRL